MLKNKQKAIVRKFIEEIYNKGNLAALDDLVDTELIFHGLSKTEDIEDIKLAIGHVREYWNTIFSDLRFTIDEIFIDGERVIVRLTKRGTFKSTYKNRMPAGSKLSVPATEIFRVTNGKVKEIWANP